MPCESVNLVMILTFYIQLVQVEVQMRMGKLH
jgi:hypothetical protein